MDPIVRTDDYVGDGIPPQNVHRLGGIAIDRTVKGVDVAQPPFPTDR